MSQVPPTLNFNGREEIWGWQLRSSPFHAGEQQLQRLTGQRDTMEEFGREVICHAMPDQHRQFYAQLPFVVLATVDDSGAPWATLLCGPQGFASTRDRQTLTFDTFRLKEDPACAAFAQGRPVGILGIELSSRRRNRMNGRVSAISPTSLSVHVDQAFGNCPQYIQKREVRYTRDASAPFTPTDVVVTADGLDAAAVEWIEQSDTFFVATSVAATDDPLLQGADASHRGGKPGFVRVEGNVLTIPDYAGNGHFNTLGNILVNPKAGLTFPDFETGGMLFVTGTAELVLDGPLVTGFRGAERAWKVTVTKSVRIGTAALPLRFEFVQWSMNTKITGDWSEFEKTAAAEAQRKAWRPFTVAKITEESSTIKSFQLTPADGHPALTFKAGQYLSLRIPHDIASKTKPTDASTTSSVDAVDGTVSTTTPEHDNEDGAGAGNGIGAFTDVRSYTVSSAPHEAFYRISVKKEPHGAVSTILHDIVSVGDTVEVKAPMGDFTFDADAKKPHAVLLCGGVGTTPMASFVQHNLFEGIRTRHVRQTTVVQYASTMEARAFTDELQSAERRSRGAVQFLSVLTQGTAADVEASRRRGIATVTGRVMPSTLFRTTSSSSHRQMKTKTSSSGSEAATQAHNFPESVRNAEYFLCGPASFMQGMYDDLTQNIGVPDASIFAEEFGPSSLHRTANTTTTSTAAITAGAKSVRRVVTIAETPAASSATVQFAKSNVELRWAPESGTLLQFAERHGLAPEFGCRKGNCAQCVVRLMGGAVSYRAQVGVDIEDAHCLPCMAVPAAGTGTVVLDM